MIEPTDEMVEAVDRALTEAAGTGTGEARAAARAVLAIVARDYCVSPRPAWATPVWLLGRGGSHPHYCVSCSDGDAPGPGCGNCRQTGMDQTPWPRCEGCRS